MDLILKQNSPQSIDTKCSETLSLTVPGVVLRRLTSCYPDDLLGNKTNALDELLYILLSLQTNEQLYCRSYAAFKTKFPRWDLVALASVERVKQTIRESGLAEQKARHICAIARRLKSDFGRVTLAPLKKMSVDEAESYMVSLPGVGIKTARCVLMYSLGHTVFPVDIHCARIMNRLGLVNWNGRRLETIANAAQDAIPSDLRRQFHILLVQHGREVCRSTPECSRCVLTDLCPSAFNQQL